MEIRDRYYDYIPVYTDGSRDGNYVSYATVEEEEVVVHTCSLFAGISEQRGGGRIRPQ